MDPNNNQPGASGQQPQPGGPPEWPPQRPPVPDWQQGLGTGAATPPTPQAPQVQSVPGQMPPMSNQGPASQPPAPPMQPAPHTPPVPGSMQAISGAGTTPPRRFRRTLLILAIVLVMVVAVTVAALVIFGGDDGSDAGNAAKSSSGSSKDKKATDLGTLNNVAFGLPADLSAFKGDSSPDSSYHVYLTQGSTDQKACSLEFGTLAADELPGDTIDGIVDPQVENLKKAGASVEGPTAGEALLLKDGSDDSITYSIPTLKYDFTKDGKHIAVHYSLAILKNGNRAVISRQCANAGGEADAATLAKVEAAAKQITVHKR